MDKFSQKGVSLYLAIVIMTILLAIVLGLTGILVSQIKMIRGMEDSVIAFYAADTGNEKGLLVVRGYSGSYSDLVSSSYKESLNIDGDGVGGLTDGCPAGLQDDGDACYQVNVLATLDCPGAESYCIKSNGYYKETSRAVETQR